MTTNRIYIKIGWIFVIGLLVYLAFVIFYFSPKINDYLSNTQLNETKEKFNKIVTFINQKINYKSKELDIKNEIKLVASSVTLGKSGYINIFDAEGNVIFDNIKEFKDKNISTFILPNTKSELFFDKLKQAYKNKEPFFYRWNKTYDPTNYDYNRVSWVRYNEKEKWYIVGSAYLDESKTFADGMNSFMINVSLILFAILLLIGIFIAVTLIIPLNKMFSELKKLPVGSNSIQDIAKNKDEIGFLTNQFNSLLNQVENSHKSMEEHVEKKTKEIKSRLYVDELTSLKNRTALEEEIEGNDFVSIILIDIDDFGDINELYGFSIGNLVLIEVARILTDFSQKYNLSVYRLDGNVFSLCDQRMIQTSRIDEFINDLASLFKNQVIKVEGLDSDIYINVTFGLAFSPDINPLEAARIALKTAKKERMPYIVYSPELDTKEIIKETMYWSEKIKFAIEHDNIIPFYQPIFDRNNNIVKYETLMRMKRTDENGNIEFERPYKFLDIAIKTKQYALLSTMVIQKALADLSKTDKQISINISFKDILDFSFKDSLNRMLDKIEPQCKERIVFEILESDYVTDYRILHDFITDYRQQGIKIAIDDFGTGFSNFAHVLQIRPDYLKIDASLIKNIHTDKSSLEMVKSIIEFAKALNIRLIAEFVHSKEVLDILVEIGIDEFQGFYLGEPSLIIE